MSCYEKADLTDPLEELRTVIAATLITMFDALHPNPETTFINQVVESS